MFNIGIVGDGVVGSAIGYGFQKLGHTVSVHDMKYDTTIDDIKDTEVVFVCVPTPLSEDERCDVRVVQDVMSELNAINYTGIIAIKSTVEPGTTRGLRDSYPDLVICFVPEFLRERCAITDFTENHDLCVIGTDDAHVFETIKEVHGNLPKQVVQLTETEAELAKYFSNTYNATVVTFANNFYEICKKLNVEYMNVKNAIVKRDHIVDQYLDCNENFRGFGGMCLPKDTRALNSLSKMLETGGNLFQTVIDENDRYKTTVFRGMRNEH